jgi:hypothetical protein
MRAPTKSHRRWSRNPAPRRATVLELLLFFAVALTGFAGVAGIVAAFSMRDFHFEQRGLERGAALTVEWRFFGTRVWQSRYPRIIDAEARRFVTRGDYSASDPNPAPQVDTPVVLLDAQHRAAFTVRQSSHTNEVKRMHDYLTGVSAAPGGLLVRETERWWASDLVSDLFGCALGLLLGLALGIFSLVGAVTALWVRLAATQELPTSGGVFPRSPPGAKLGA